MAKVLRDYFPMIRTREEIQRIIAANEMLQNRFEAWEENFQERFLNFCTGAGGIKILYDSFFKEIMSPEYHPERLEQLLSLILNCKVKIQEVLPNDSVRIAEEGSLLITDIVVALEDGSLVNVEIQKLGYKFPGERCACYSADLLLRQYKRVKSRLKKKFSYKDIKSVYTIILFEDSPRELKEFPDDYIHHSKQCFNTGLEMNMLQEFVLIPLDIYRKNRQDKGIRNELDAWLAFLSQDKPDEIVELIELYPQFKKIYQSLYDFCQNVEDVMGLFSKELYELDRNTVQYMIEEQQEIIDKQKAELEDKDKALEEKDRLIAELLKKQNAD